MFGYINKVDEVIMLPRDLRVLTLYQSRSQFAVSRVVMMMAVKLRK